jgi:hypothetical protein
LLAQTDASSGKAMFKCVASNGTRFTSNFIEFSQLVQEFQRGETHTSRQHVNPIRLCFFPFKERVVGQVHRKYYLICMLMYSFQIHSLMRLHKPSTAG